MLLCESLLRIVSPRITLTLARLCAITRLVVFVVTVVVSHGTYLSAAEYWKQKPITLLHGKSRKKTERHYTAVKQ